jgi:predicted HTH transcriptional regulator
VRNLGSGFPLILSAWNEKHWLKPELIEQPELMQVKLILHIVNEEDESKNEPKNEPKELSERQLRVLHAISTNNTLTIG